jgi:hypothetical protein
MQHQNNKCGQKSIFCNGLKIYYNELQRWEYKKKWSSRNLKKN